MSNPHDQIVRLILLSCVLAAFIAYDGMTAAIAQVLPPISNPSPGSTLTTTTVTFTGGNAGQAGEQHWLSVETAPYAKDIFNESLGSTNSASVSGLPTSGTLYVRYHTYTPVAGWNAQSHTYTMNVGTSGGNSGGGTTGENGDNSDGGNTGGSSAGEGHQTLRWDQAHATAERFVLVMGEEGVLDKDTGLVWQKSPLTDLMPWPSARAHCLNYIVEGRKGWRVPSVNELASLVDPTIGGPALPAGHPFIGVQSLIYWSATQTGSLSSTTLVPQWVVHFGSGLVAPTPKSASGLAWCVRSGATLSNY